MSLRIAFDLDGVLADIDRELARHARALFSASPPLQTASADEPPEAETALVTREGLPLTSRQEKELWRHVRSLENFWETIEELERGVVSRLAALAAERRWEVIFLTSRPESAGDTGQVQTQRWLESKGFVRPSVFVVNGSRGLIAASLGLDFVIDDRVENCMDVVADSRARAVLVWRTDVPPPAAVARLGIHVQPTTGKALDMLEEAEPARSNPRGAVDRVKRFLGIGASSAHKD